MRRAAAQQAEPLVAHDEVGQHQHEHSDDAHPRRQEQQLLEKNPATVAALAFQQKLHRCPANPLLPAQIDQVDQYGHGNQRQADREQGGEKEGHVQICHRDRCRLRARRCRKKAVRAASSGMLVRIRA